MVKVVIKKATGEVRVASPTPPGEWNPEPLAVPQLTEGVLPDGEHWEYKPVPGYIDDFCARLKVAPPEEMGLKQDVYIAAALGFGSAKAHALLWDNKFADEWPYIIPWFTRPDVGDWILPPEATWAIQRRKVDGGEEGWATLTVGDKTWASDAKTPWAAFAICLLQARKDGAIKAKMPQGKST